MALIKETLDNKLECEYTCSPIGDNEQYCAVTDKHCPYFNSGKYALNFSQMEIRGIPIPKVIYECFLYKENANRDKDSSRYSK